MQHGLIAHRRLALALALTLVAGVRAVAAESLGIQWDPNPEADVIGYRVFIGSQPGVYDSQVDVGNVTSYTIATVQAGRQYCFAVAAFSAGPTVGSKSGEVCTDSNKPPTLQSPGNQTSAVGTALTLTLNGTDPEGLPITFSATGLPAGLTLNPNTGFISGTPTTVATTNVTVTVSDGVLSTSQAFTWTISASLPAAATLLRPSGTLATATPTFEWESVATATSYRLWVDDSSTTDPKIQLDLTPTQASCGTAGAVCRVSPGVLLQAGRGAWSVRASNISGAGPWSGAMDFTVPDTKVPTVTIATPTTGSSYTTSAASIALGGTATDDAGVSLVTWTNNLGGSGTATGTASWGVAAVPVRVGTNIITVTARDNGGNIGTKTLTVTKSDSQVPTLAIVSPNAGYSTRLATLAMNGSASDDGGVTQVTWASDRGGSGTAAGTTAWSIAAIPLKLGANIISVTAHDGAGNNTTQNLTATLTDGEAPVVSITSPSAAASFATGSETVALGGTASDAFGVAQVTWSNDKGGSGTALSSPGTTTWSVPAVALKPGANVITVTARDAAGNTGTDSITVTVTVPTTDGVAPVVMIVAPTSVATFTTASGMIALGGTASDAVGVTQVKWASSQGAAGTATGTTAWAMAVALQVGVNVITVTAHDAAGNAGTDVLTVTRTGGVAPTVVITTPAANTVTSAPTVSLTGTAKDDVGVTEVAWTNNRGGSGRATGTTSWTIADVALQTGVNVITVVAQDASGNRTSASVTVTRDALAPTVSIVTPASATFVTNQASVALGGKAADDAGVKQVTWVNSRGGSGAATGTTDWAVPTVALQVGTNRITITARDGSGNVGIATVTVILDTTAPVISIATPTTASSFTTPETGIALGGVATDDTALAAVTWTNSAGGSGAAAGTSTWATPRIALQAGLNTLTVTARDAAGNVALATLTVRSNPESGLPKIALTSPTPAATYATSSPNVALTGVASDDSSVARVTWSTDKGQTGNAVGTTSWSIPLVSVPMGTTVVKVTAYDNAGNTASVSLTITYSDTTKPAVKIYTPTTAGSMSTSSKTVTIAGTAIDNVGVTQVTWATDGGATGTAFGAGSWSTPSLTLAAGTTTVTITARDAAGNVGVAVLSVTTTSLLSASTSPR